MATESEVSEWNKKLQEEAVSTVFQLVVKWFEKGVKLTIDKVSWKAAVENYVHRWIDRWGMIKPLGADHPIPLHQLYVQLQAVPRSFVKRFANLEEMQAAAAAGDQRGGFFSLSEHERKQQEFTPQQGMQIANEYRRLNLLGAPGGGKSTFLRRLGLEALLPGPSPEGAEWSYRGEYEHPLLPVLLELRILRDMPCENSHDIVRLLAREFAAAGFPQSIKLLLAALQHGALLILLDGVDEIHEERLKTAITAIKDFISTYPNCRYVLSCRTAFYRDWFTGFHDFILADLDETQIRDFAFKWFARPDEVLGKAPEKFLTLLYSEDHRATRELAGSPLLLTFLCLVFRKAQKFPQNRAQLYNKALRIYLEEWNASKLVHDEPIYQELTPEMELELLKEIAGPAFIEGTIFFTREELTKAIGSFLTRELNAPKSLSPGQILTAIAVQQGLLIERAEEVWTFSHLTIQEYLAAAWMLEEGQANTIIFEHAEDDRWREILLLMAGLVRADDMLEIMMDAADAIVLERPRSRLHSLVELLEEVDSIANRAWKAFSSQELGLKNIQLNPGVALMRALTFEGVRPQRYFLALWFARAHGFNLDANKAREICVKAHIESEHALRYARIQSRYKRDSVFNEDLDRYLTVVSLVCLCKECALRVSREAWDAICARWLAAPVMK